MSLSRLKLFSDVKWSTTCFFDPKSDMRVAKKSLFATEFLRVDTLRQAIKH